MSRWVVAAAILLLVLAGGAVWYVRSRPAAGPALDHWTYVPAGKLAGAGPALNPDFLTSDGKRFVAVGNTYAHDTRTAALDSWTSADGLTWRPGNLRRLAAGAGSYTVVDGLARTPDGFVVIGTRIAPATTSVVAWRSSDGLNWTPLPLPLAPSPTTRPALASDGTSLYAPTGTSTWLKLPPHGRPRAVPGAVPENCEPSYRVRTVQPGFLLYGWCPVRGAHGQRAALYTVDAHGRVRDRSPGLDRRLFELLAVARHDRTLVGIGHRYGSTSTGPSMPPAQPGEDGETRPVTTVLTRSTDDGATWSPGRAVSAGPGMPADADRVSTFGDRFLVSGTVARGGAETPALWTSTDDGATWRYHRLPGFADNGMLGDAAELHGRVVIPARTGVLPGTTRGLFVNVRPR